MRRAVSLGLGMIALAGIAAVVIVGHSANFPAQGQTAIPTPPPPGPGFTEVVPPRKARPAFYFVPSAFHGKVVHWWSTQSNFIAGASNPTNGQPINVEAWVRFGPDGAPNLYHAIATYQDGTLYQEVLRSPTEETTVYDPRLQPSAPDGSKLCVVRTPGDAGLRERLNSSVPMFVDETLLPPAGFRAVGSDLPTRPAPAAALPANLTPGQVYGQATSVDRWVRESTDRQGMRGISTFDVGIDGYLRLNQFQRLDAQGTVQNEVWFANGRLAVYDPATVQSGVFNLSREGCQ
ncbi:MAG: hypothetical protein AB7R89_07815 [Dehalococcoidia bacterium]